MEKLAIEGGKPVSNHWIPISKPIIGDEEVREVVRVLRSGLFREGELTRRFEEEFREKCGSKYALAVNSGTAALHLAFMTMIKPGDEVIVPSFTFAASVNTIVLAGGRPVFADIEERTFTLDPDDVLEKITSRTVAIEPVHLYGQPADIKALSEIAEDHGLKLVWDAAQAHGAKYQGQDVGSFDDVVCFSFYATKNMTTGEGGMITTNDEGLARRLRLMKSHGEARRYWHVELGLNYRMTELQAAIGIHQLRKLEKFNAVREENARVLTEALGRVEGIITPYVRPGCRHVFHQYTIMLELEAFRCTRNEFVEALRAENIDARVYYPVPMHQQPVYRELAKGVNLPVTEEVARRVVSLPVHPALGREDLELVVKAVEKVVDHFLKR